MTDVPKFAMGKIPLKICYNFEKEISKLVNVNLYEE